MFARLSSRKILLFFVLTLYFLLLGYKLLRLGIHGDGVEYAAVARNMADGVGTFWKPYLDDTIHPVFHEHPPLVFWIQSHFFRLFGDGPYLEAFYGFFIGLIISVLIAIRRSRSLSALPLDLFSIDSKKNEKESILEKIRDNKETYAETIAEKEREYPYSPLQQVPGFGMLDTGRGRDYIFNKI